ncbi:hypothetical protein [Mesorhizobium australicum]|uniref:Uncharacterized protein n=1 Tax=Mesorhizobium australicum TaxID=536018 RepID=A0A1X7PE55_9HYPH|nr:hypothetical protein [Mesorhizobium australicum]SMH49077.1 hypothetical protein SAMN02982922_3840 [Mesorhizobium australicum]
MKSFAERLIGKSIKKVEVSDSRGSIFVILSDESVFTVYTEVIFMQTCANDQTIERVVNSDEKVTLYLSGDDHVTISTDRQRFSDVVEFFVYHDKYGYVVEN